jgi:3-oxoacyl-[acyl-carrier protein] reductase
VTGASKGIGASIAKHLAEAGASVVVNYASSKADADKVVDQIVESGGKAFAVQGDFSKPEDIKRVFATLKAEYGKLDILVNNAGVYGFFSIADTTVEEIHRQFNLNVVGLFLSTQEAVKLIGPEGGSIINIGSIVGSMPPGQGSVYSATKGAVNTFTIAHSKELGPRKIRVNALNPGLIETEGVHAAGFMGSPFEENVRNTTPLGRIGQPNDIGKVAVFLASDESYWVTGQLLNVAGGATM